MKTSTLRDYVHRELDEEVVAIGGRYTLTAEVRLPLGDREILYVLGWAAFDTTCCGAGGCSYALVPGFIVDWKTRRNGEGLEVSLLEPILDPSVQDAVSLLIKGKEIVQQVTFL
ncbi:MAG: hypothetical protein ABSF90_02445 [Syntrophobacteraceae bacterium]|jgi:hypothetical protein